MGKAEEHRRCQSCVEFEALVDKWERGDLTTKELSRIFVHMQDCPLGQHTPEAIEEECALQPGSLRNWNGQDPRPRPSAKTAVAMKQAKAEAKRGKPSKRQWKPLSFSQRMGLERALADTRDELHRQDDGCSRQAT